MRMIKYKIAVNWNTIPWDEFTRNKLIICTQLDIRTMYGIAQLARKPVWAILMIDDVVVMYLFMHSMVDIIMGQVISLS